MVPGKGRWEQRAQCRRRFVFSIDVILPPQVDNPTRESSESGARQMMAAVQQAKRSGAKWHVVIAYEVYVLRSVLLAMHTAGLYGEGRSLARLRARVRLRADLCVCGRGWLCTDVCVFVCVLTGHALVFVPGLLPINLKLSYLWTAEDGSDTHTHARPLSAHMLLPAHTCTRTHSSTDTHVLSTYAQIRTQLARKHARARLHTR